MHKRKQMHKLFLILFGHNTKANLHSVLHHRYLKFSFYFSLKKASMKVQMWSFFKLKKDGIWQYYNMIYSLLYSDSKNIVNTTTWSIVFCVSDRKNATNTNYPHLIWYHWTKEPTPLPPTNLHYEIKTCSSHIYETQGSGNSRGEVED